MPFAFWLLAAGRVHVFTGLLYNCVWWILDVRVITFGKKKLVCSMLVCNCFMSVITFLLFLLVPLVGYIL